MKKKLSVLIAMALTVGVLAGCGANNATNNATKDPATSTSTDKTATEGKIAKMGIGQTTSIGKSKDLDGIVTPVGQVDTVIVAAGFDKDGKVVSVTIDTAQTKVEFNEDLSLKSDKAAEQKTKKELKEEYGMLKASGIKKEWYQQMEALENWMVGKTVEEIKGMKLKDGVTEEADLTSSVTVTVDGYLAALEEAYTNAVEVKGAEKVGLGHNISIAKSAGYENEEGGLEILPLAQVDTVMSATAFDKDGKVAGTIIDTAQTKIEFDAEGKITTDKAGEFKTKLELKEEYGMLKASGIKKEWYQQAQALGDWMVGKTADEVKGMKVKEKDASHPAVPDEADLTSSVTISVEHYIDAVAEASEKAK